MSESLVRVVGVKQDIGRQCVNLVFLCKKNTWVWTAEASIEDLSQAFEAVSEVLFLIPSFLWKTLDFLDLSYLIKIQEEISAFFYELRYREDLFSHPEIQDLLSIPYLSIPLEFLSILKVSDTYTVTSFKIVPEAKAIIVGCQYTSVFKKIGKLWSLIEAQQYGQMVICGFDYVLYKRETIKLREQIRCCYWKESTFEGIFGMESGDLMRVTFKMKLGPDSKGIYDGEKMIFANKKVFKLHTGPIIAIAGANDVIITIGTDSILKVSVCKIVNKQTEDIETIGGGSLKQRLSTFESNAGAKQAGNDKLISLFFDKVTKKVFLGSELGRILVYLLENSIPKYQYTVVCGEPIYDLDVHLGCLYLATGSSIAIYSDCKNYEILAHFRPALDNCKITCIKYLQSQERVFTGFSNGMLLAWHTMIFQLLVAVKIFDDAIIALEIDEKNSVIAVCSCSSEIKLMNDDASLVPRPFEGHPNIYTLQERDCIGCEAKIEHIQSIKDALEEVFEENEALRTRVVELEAWVNKAADKLEKRENTIESLHSEIGEFSNK